MYFPFFVTFSGCPKSLSRFCVFCILCLTFRIIFGQIIYVIYYDDITLYVKLLKFVHRNRVLFLIYFKCRGYHLFTYNEALDSRKYRSSNVSMDTNVRIVFCYSVLTIIIVLFSNK